MSEFVYISVQINLSGLLIASEVQKCLNIFV